MENGISFPPSPPETRSAGQRDVADVGRRGAGDGLVDDEGAVLEVGAALLLHLPEVLQRLHDIDCNRMMGGRKWLSKKY